MQSYITLIHLTHFIAFPCTAFSMARFFPLKPTAENGYDKGPPVIINLDHPNGKPDHLIDPKHRKELKQTIELLTRTCELVRLARASPANTTVIWEAPARRSVKGTNHYCEDLPLHSTVFDTDQFKNLIGSEGTWRSCTFSWCRLGSDAQKYTTFYYTSDAATALDPLNGPNYQCNHQSHERQAGGKKPDGSWASDDYVCYPEQVNARIAIAGTIARTGSARPLPRPPSREEADPINDIVARTPNVASSPPVTEAHQPVSPGGSATIGSATPGGSSTTPRGSTPNRPAPVSFSGFTGASTTSQSPGSPAYVPFNPQALTPSLPPVNK